MTISLDTKYRKPVPYETELIGRGVVEKTRAILLLQILILWIKKGKFLQMEELNT